MYACQNSYLTMEMNTGTDIDIVPDKRSRIHEVVVVRRYSPGYWEFGVGREWERAEKWRSVYE
jgi:hypothetical protein